MKLKIKCFLTFVAAICNPTHSMEEISLVVADLCPTKSIQNYDHHSLKLYPLVNLFDAHLTSSNGWDLNNFKSFESVPSMAQLLPYFSPR